MTLKILQFCSYFFQSQPQRALLLRAFFKSPRHSSFGLYPAVCCASAVQVGRDEISTFQSVSTTSPSSFCLYTTVWTSVLTNGFCDITATTLPQLLGHFLEPGKVWMSHPSFGLLNYRLRHRQRRSQLRTPPSASMAQATSVENYNRVKAGPFTRFLIKSAQLRTWFTY